MNRAQIKKYLDRQIDTYNNLAFIENDPISIPHGYSIMQDVEITAFWTAMLSWGQRKTIINKSKELFSLMDNSPYEFILHHTESDLKAFTAFKHRTFQPDDALYFIHWLKSFYSKNKTLENAFFPHESMTVSEALTHFHNQFFNLPEALQRTKKHVSTPLRLSSCKRLNMFLRWMIRSDNQGVDFGIWKRISPAQLMIPLDIHVFTIARSLGLLKRDKADWQSVEELTQVLRKWRPEDPVIYDYALFSIGLEGRNFDIP